MFKDRKDAGKKLARSLENYRGENPIVLAIPRGGVEVGYHVALHLESDFTLIICRKLPYPHNPESGFGAVAEDGDPVILSSAGYPSGEDINRIIQEQKDEIRRRVEVLRGGEPLPEIEGRTVILVDDGVAMGSTMRAALALCRKRKAGKIVVAAPVAGPGVAGKLEKMADDAVILETPPGFRAVAQVYQKWYDVPDREVLDIMAGSEETQRVSRKGGGK